MNRGEEVRVESRTGSSVASITRRLLEDALHSALHVARGRFAPWLPVNN